MYVLEKKEISDFLTNLGAPLTRGGGGGEGVSPLAAEVY